MIIEIFLVFLLTILYLYLYTYSQHGGLFRRKDEPPGPMNWPIFGNLPQIAQVNWTRVWFAIDHYAQIYGDVMGLYFGSRYVVVLSTPQAVNDTMKLDEWNGRPRDYMSKVKGDGSSNNALGLIWTDGALWKETRRFSIRHLRDFGFGRAEMEASIIEEVRLLDSHICTNIIDKNDGILSFEKVFGIPVLSTLWKMVAGTHCTKDDAQIEALQTVITRVLRQRAIGAGIYWSFQYLRYLFPKQSGYLVQKEGFAEIKNYMKELIKQHKKSRSVGEKGRDFIDAYLLEMEKSPGNENFFEEQLATICMDFMVAGSETTNTTLQYCFLYLILYPDVQKKIQNEIDSCIGKNRRISLADKDKLVYVEATITEIHRIASVAPIITPHSTTESVEYKGYKIPKDSIIFINTWGIHRNKEKWIDPDVFRPERFLDENGNILQKDEWILPFGAGKRKCPGEILAKSSIFLILTNFLQKFEFYTIPGEPEPSTIPVVGLNLIPQPFSALVVNRKH